MNTILKFLTIYGLCLFCFISILNGQINQVGPKPNSVKEAISKPWGKLFYIERIDGKYKMGDSLSHFDKNKNFEALTFDISNNKVLANVGVQGTLKSLTFYRDSYFANCSPSSGLTDGNWPGVWAAKDNSSYGPYSFTLDIDGLNYDLDKVSWDFRTGLLDNIIPITEFKGPNDQFSVKILTFAPISTDGKQRIRGAVYGLYLENKSNGDLNGTIHLPKLMKTVRKRINSLWTDSTSWAALDPYDYEMALGDKQTSNPDISFSLGTGEHIWVPAVFYNLGDSALQEINQTGTLSWLNQTSQYFRKMLGQIKTPQYPYLAEFFERQVMEAFGSIAMSASGKIAGSNWGSYPATRQIWMKDFYYTSLPFMMLDKEFAQKIILWFNEFGVRPKGSIKEGGVNHSVGISMASIMLAGIYYQNSGDKQFFLQNPQLQKNWEKILKELIASRKDPDIWLFPSKYISDGYILPDYHTGSNVCAWFALKSYAGFMKEVYAEPNEATCYEDAAGKVHAAILERCTINGPYGKQFIEATYKDGREAPMESDGEESDLTLMPFYGFLSWDDPTYLNYMKFSMSEKNTIYSPKLHAIKWYDVPSTAPGYMKGVCAGTDYNSLFGEHGYITEIRKITDADGSIWWWTYGWGEKGVTPPYGQVVRGNPGGFGKAGWFSGIYAAVFMNRQLGLAYDKSNNTLKIRPIMPSGGYDWSNFSLGQSHFSVGYQFDKKNRLMHITNSNTLEISAEIALPVLPDNKKFQLLVNKKGIKDFELVKYLGRDYVSFKLKIPKEEKANIQLISKGSKLNND